jgi:hypothetical protein
LERQFLQQNATLGHIIPRQGDEAAAFRQADRADKEFAQVYPHAAIGIQMLCEAPTPAGLLPPLFKFLANTKKKDAAMVIQAALVDAHARMPNSTHVSPVVTTPEIIENIYAFKAGTHDVDDLTSGFSPFLFVMGSLEATTLARARAVTYYSHLYGGMWLPPWTKSGKSFPGPRRCHTLLSPPWSAVIRATARSWM